LVAFRRSWRLFRRPSAVAHIRPWRLLRMVGRLNRPLAASVSLCRVRQLAMLVCATLSMACTHISEHNIPENVTTDRPSRIAGRNVLRGSGSPDRCAALRDVTTSATVFCRAILSAVGTAEEAHHALVRRAVFLGRLPLLQDLPEPRGWTK